MLFNSYKFLLFFPVVIILYYLLPHKFRWIMLLASSFLFYMAWKAEYIVLMLVCIGMNYLMSILMDRTENKAKRKLFLLSSLIVSLGILFVFKYFNFINESVLGIFSFLKLDYPVNNFSLLLPMGISFYTFQTMSYTIDVYNKKRKAERHIGYFALYVSYFPQLVAGPIERSDRLLPQLKAKQAFDYDRAKHGLQRMLWGFFQKIVIADTIAIVVNNVYNAPRSFGGLAFIIATVSFAIQIFCDFAGYTNIAIGCAQVMGIELMENFRQPYFAVSIGDFWSRWHISLSTWFRDYVYIPLGGNRAKKPRHYLNIFITFLLSGLWHGANWTFVLWGSIHGFLRIAEDILSSLLKKAKIRILPGIPRLKRVMRALFVFTLVCFAWIFFRANNINDALYIIRHLFSDAAQWLNPAYIDLVRNSIGFKFVSVFLPVAAGILLSGIIWAIKEKGESPFIRFNNRSITFRWSFYIILSLVIILMFILSDATPQFIYFQF